MSYLDQILTPPKGQKDSTNKNWNKLPFIEESGKAESSVLIPKSEQSDTTYQVVSKKKNKSNYKSEFSIYSVQDSDSLALENGIQDTLLTVTENSAKSTIIQPSFFQEHALKPNQIDPVQNKIENPDWFTIILIVLVIAFTYIKFSYNKVFKQLLNAFFSKNVTNQIIREENVMVQRASIILSIIFYLAGGLFLYQLGNYLNWQILGISNGFGQFLIFALLIASSSPLKMIVLKILGFIFESDKLTATYSFNIFLINNVLGLLLIPLVAFIAYVPLNIESSMLFLGIGIVFISFLYRLIKGFSIWQSAGRISVFYFILYLCTLEIAPILVLFKIASQGS